MPGGCYPVKVRRWNAGSTVQYSTVVLTKNMIKTHLTQRRRVNDDGVDWKKPDPFASLCAGSRASFGVMDALPFVVIALSRTVLHPSAFPSRK